MFEGGSNYHPVDPVERVFQDAYHRATGRWIAPYAFALIKRALPYYRGLRQKIVNNPSNVAGLLFGETNHSNQWYFPCDIIDLRHLLRSHELAWHAPILMFGQKAAARLMPEYPLCLVFDRDVAKDGLTLGGVHVRLGNRLPVAQSLKHIVVRDFLSERQLHEVNGIVRGALGHVPVYLMTDLPGIQRQASVLRSPEWYAETAKLAKDTEGLETYFGFRHNVTDSGPSWISWDVFDSRKGLEGPTVITLRTPRSTARTQSQRYKVVKSQLLDWLKGLRANAALASTDVPQADVPRKEASGDPQKMKRKLLRLWLRRHPLADSGVYVTPDLSAVELSVGDGMSDAFPSYDDIRSSLQQMMGSDVRVTTSDEGGKPAGYVKFQWDEPFSADGAHMGSNWYTRMKLAEGPSDTFGKPFLIGKQPQKPDPEVVQQQYESPHEALSLKRGDRVAYRYTDVKLPVHNETKSLPMTRSLVQDPKSGTVELIDSKHIHVKWDGAKEPQMIPLDQEMFLIKVSE